MVTEKQFRIYLSHPIRGLNRDVSREEEIMIMEENNKMAIMAAALIRSICPHIDVYCPAEHEDFVCKAYYCNMLTEKQILDIDCAIIDDCDMSLFFNHQGGFSSGMKREYNHCVDTQKTTVIVTDFYELTRFAIACSNGRTFHV